VIPCKICDSPTEPVGTCPGKYIRSNFEVVRCGKCHFAFVTNPHVNPGEIYGDDYYRGKGADPLVDYEFEANHPDTTIRRYEWRGIARAVVDYKPVNESTKWLDFGCGTGGLVRYCRDHLKCQAFGYDSGTVHRHLRDLGSHLLTHPDLEKYRGTFDIVTAIEVLEHVPDPIAELRVIRSLLKPGGLFFFTTGNAQPYSQQLLRWRYVTPEIHISFFEPISLDVALQKAGFRPEYGGFRPGFEDIIRFKILKNIHARQISLWERLLPWQFLTRIADSKYKISAHPIGWATDISG
jgi:SAM-dependent methyltransferase